MKQYKSYTKEDWKLLDGTDWSKLLGKRPEFRKIRIYNFTGW